MIINEIPGNEDFRNSRKKGQKKKTFARPKKLKKAEKKCEGANPFQSGLRIKVISSYDRFQMMINEKLISKSIYISTTEEKDRIIKGDFQPQLIENGYVRLYENSGLKNLKFNHTTNTLLLYIILRITNGDSLVLINKQDIVDTKKLISKDTFYNAIEELTNNNIIKKSHKKNYYWINVEFFFNGNRPNYFLENVYTVEERITYSYDTIKETFRQNVLKMKNSSSKTK